MRENGDRAWCGQCDDALVWSEGWWRHLYPVDHHAVLGSPTGKRVVAVAEPEIVVERPPHPAPEVPAVKVELRWLPLEHIPKSAASFARLADRNGFDVVLSYARGTSIDAQGRTAYVTVRKPLLDQETGAVETTLKGNPRFENVKTDIPVVVDSVLLRAHRPGSTIVMVWHDGALESAWYNGSRSRSDDIRELIKEDH